MLGRKDRYRKKTARTEGYEGEKGCFRPNVVYDSGLEFLQGPSPTEEGIVGNHSKVARE